MKNHAYWICAVIAAANALTSLGFSIAALSGATGDAATNAQYAFTRSLALAIVALALLAWRRSNGAAIAVAAVLALMQLGDGFVGIGLGDPVKYLGPFFLAFLTAWAAFNLWSTTRRPAPAA